MTAMKHDLRHVDRFVDRHGKTHHYFRRGHGPRVRLPGEPGSAEFLKAYQAALEGQAPSEPKKHLRGEPGTFDRLLQDYYSSPEFLALKAATRTVYRLTFDRWVRDDKIGHRLVRDLTRDHIKKMVAKRSATPAAANDLVKKIKLLMTFAIGMTPPLRTDNPAVGIKKFAEGEHHTWTDAEIETFEASWPLDSKERLAFALHLYTGQRTSDVRKMSWADIDAEGLMRVVQQKTGNKIWVAMHHRLRAILAATPRRHHVILTTAWGKPYATRSLGYYMAGKIGDAGLPDECVTHGLRKAAARRLAEAGCSAIEIMSITGHKSLEEVERYVREANQKMMAKSAIRRLEEHDANKNSQTAPKSLGEFGNTEAVSNG
jgi:integrase